MDPSLDKKIYSSFENKVILTALTAGVSSDAEIATPTKDLVLPPSIENPTPTPDGVATRIPM